MKNLRLIMLILIGCLLLSGCGKSENTAVTESTTEELTETEDGGEEMQSTETSIIEENTQIMTVTVNNQKFTATLEENDAVKELITMMQEEPVTISMKDYSGFEKVGSLGRSLPTDNQDMTTTSGDIVLYNGDQIVIFYGSNSWSYTKLGKIDNLTKWADALGNSGVTVTFSLK